MTGTATDDHPPPSKGNREKKSAEGGASRKKKIKATPMPMDQMVPMTFVLLNESMASTMLLPFAPMFVASMLHIEKEQAGYYTGWLVGAFMMGQVISAKFWGWLSDLYGRRLPLVSGLFLSGLMMLAFGLCTNFYVALLCRLLHGLFNGNSLVAKTMMADITDKTNEAKGFAFVSLCWGIGLLIGPALGGSLYDPRTQSLFSWMHISETNIFAVYPALLPALFIFLYTLVGVFCCTFFVKESNLKAKPIPTWIKILLPCMMRKAVLFIKPERPPIENVEDADRNIEETLDNFSVCFPMACVGPAGLLALEGVRRLDVLVGERLAMEADEDNRREEARRLDAKLARSFSRMPSFSDSDDFDHYTPVSSLEEEELAAPHTTPRSELSRSSNQSPSRAAASSVSAAPREEQKEDARELSSLRSSYSRKSSAAAAGQKSAAAEAQGASGAPEGNGAVIVVEAEEPILKHFGYKQCFQRPTTGFMMLMYMLVAGGDAAFSDAISLWAVAKISVGGLNLNTSQTGYLLLSNSVPCVLSNIVFPKVSALFSNKMGMMRLSTMITGLSIALIPFMSMLPHVRDQSNTAELEEYQGNRIFAYLMVALFLATRQFCSSWCYGLCTMLTARSAPLGHVGSVMGINQSCGSFTRAIVPPIADRLFAWSISGNHIFPFNYFFVFFLSTLIYIISFLLSYMLQTFKDGHMEIVINLKELLCGKKE